MGGYFLDDATECTVPRSACLRDVIEVINTAATQIALVVDEKRRLLGTVTDGDVRRAILAGGSLDSSVTDVMNESPQTLGVGADEWEALDLMNRERIHQIPLLDGDGRVAGLFTLGGLSKPSRRSNLAVVMAGGKGRRLMPLSAGTPKPMVAVGGRPMLEIVMEQCIAHGFGRFYLAVNHLKDQIIDHVGDGSGWGVEVSYLEETSPMGTAGALGLLPEKPDLPVLVINADVLTRVNLSGLMRFHEEHAADVTVAVREHQTSIPFGIVYADGVAVRGLEEKPSFTFWVSAGVYVVSPAVVERVEPDQYVDMPQLLQSAIERDEAIIAYPIHEYWIDAGHPAAVAIAEDEWRA